MKIIIVGGYLYGYAGDIQVIKNLARNISTDNDVYLFPVLPVIQKSDIYNDLKVIKKEVTLPILKKCIINSVNWFKTVFYFLKKNSIRNLSYYFITLFNKICLEKAIREINPDIIHVHGLAIDQLPLIDIALERDIPLMVTVHGMLKNYDNIYFRLETEEYCLKKTVNYKSSLLTTVSTSVKDYLVENYQIKPSLIEVIPNGANKERFYYKSRLKELREIYNLPGNKKILIQVGSLNDIKNHLAVLNAINHMETSLKNNLLYLIIGDGPQRKDLEDYCITHDLCDQVKFIGIIPNKELIDWYNLADLMIVPSYSEGFSLVFLEALSCGLPIITFKDLKAASEIYNPQYMYLIKKRSTEDLIISLQQALNIKWDRTKIASLSKEWDWSITSAEYKELYENLRVKNH